MNLLVALPLIFCLNLYKSSKGNPYTDTNKLRITIFSYFTAPDLNKAKEQKDDERGFVTGHSFIEIKNISGSYAMVGHVGLINNACLTIGCWPDPLFGGAIWYNKEAHDSSGWQNMSHSSLTINITDLEATLVDSFLLFPGNSYYNLLYHTCANVALEIWNLLAPQSLLLSPTFPNLPEFLKYAIESKNGYSTSSAFSNTLSYGYIDSDGVYVSC